MFNSEVPQFKHVEPANPRKPRQNPRAERDVRSNELIVDVPYIYAFQHAFKGSIPREDRYWDELNKVWRVSPAFVEVAIDLLTAFYPEIHLIELDDYQKEVMDDSEDFDISE